MNTRPHGAPFRLRDMAAGFASAASNIRGRVAALDHASAGSPASWAWSGKAASDYTRTWQNWRTAAETLADRMDSSSGRGARQVLNHLAHGLESAQRAYDDAVTRAQTLGLGVDARGWVTPRSVPAPYPLPAGSPEQQVEAQLASAAEQGEQALQLAGDQLDAIFDMAWYDAMDRLNNFLGWPTTAQSLISLPTQIKSGASYLQSARNLPGLAARLFNEEVGPAALAFDRGEGTYVDLIKSVTLGLNRIEAAKAFTVVTDRASFLGYGGGVLNTLGKVAIPFAVAGDIMTLINPGPGGDGEHWANRVAAGANLVGTAAWVGGMVDGAAFGGALLGVDAALGWVPVAGQVLLVASGLVLAGIWAYNNVKPFHDFCDTAVSDTKHVAQDAWNSVSQGVSNAGQGVSNAFGGATHALQGFFHWP
jgi:uncharacterized protein YukE